MIGDIWVQGSVIIFAASLIQSLTGFGFGLVAVPLLLFILPSQEALVVAMILSTFSFLIHGVKTYKQARWELIRRLLLISIPGLFLGVVLSGYLNTVFIKGIVGVVLIVYVIWQWMLIQKKNALLMSSDGIMNLEISKGEASRKSPLKFYSAGFLSGILNGLVGIPGPPIVALLVKNLDKDTFQATTVNFFIFQYTITLGTRLIIQENVLTPPLIVMMLYMVIPIVLGHLVGQPIRKRINEDNFKRLVFTLLFIIGITSAWEPIKVFLI
jgi:uncharacterized membrane protein YfcA